MFPIIFALTLAPWVIRNSVLADYRAFSSTPEWTFYFFSAAAVQAKMEHKTLLQVQEERGVISAERYLEKHPEQRTWSDGQIARFWRNEGSETISNHLLVYLYIHAKGCLVVMFDPGVTDILKTVRLYPKCGGLLSRTLDQGFYRAVLWLFRQYPVTVVMVPLLIAQLLLYFTLALAGLRRLSVELSFLFAALILYFVLVSGVPAAVSRYRMPIMPLICITAGVALATWKMKNPRAGQPMHEIVN
jgi:hypothetical protein